MVPNVGGTSGIIYNPEEVPGGVDSYRDLFEDPALAGKVTLEDSAQHGHRDRPRWRSATRTRSR